MNDTKPKTVFEERDEAIWLMNKMSMELNKVKLQLGATQEALAQVQRESAELRRQEENVLDGLRTAAVMLHVSLHFAATGVRWEECEDCEDIRKLLPEYRAQVSHGPCQFKFNEPEPLPPAGEPCDLGHDNPSMRQKGESSLSPSKQAAIDRGIAKAEKIEEMWENN